LPGGSGLLYSIQDARSHPSVAASVEIWDPTVPVPQPQQMHLEFDVEYRRRLAQWKRNKNNPSLIGKLELDPLPGFPLPGALQVNTITVDEDYRGRGIAKALYGIVLTIMRRPLVAGYAQTPGGRQNWVSLASIPGVEIRGYVSLEDDLLNPNTDFKPARKPAEQRIDIIMGRLGGEYLGDSVNGNHYFAFDVQPNRTGRELEAYVKTNLSKVYNETYDMTTGLYAVWTGQ